MTEFEGTPCAVKVACTVWSGGKSGDNFKGLPITIWRQISGHEAAYGRCWCSRCWYGSCTSALRAVLCLSVPA